MRERAQALGGTFAITQRPEGGTRVMVRLPSVGGQRDAAEAFPQRLAG
jgi:nitrate/nitrite-specific signal transduction histidine kinase